MKNISLIVLLVFAWTGLHAADYTTVKDIRYRDGGGSYVSKMCRLDLNYVDGAQDRPVIVWFHGGGLTGGGKTTPTALLAKDFVVVSVGYRFITETPLEDIIDDAALAVSWVWNNAEKYGGSRQKFYIAGHSAGGYLVDMIGLDKKYLGKYGIDPDKFAAIVPYSGQSITHFAQRKKEGRGALSPTVDEFAPMYHVRGDAAPMLVISGDRDMEMNGRYEESAYFVKMLRLNGHKDVTFYELDGYGHSAMADPAHPLFLKYIEDREKPASFSPGTLLVGVSSSCSDTKVSGSLSYLEAVERAGGVPVVLPVVKDEKAAEALVGRMDALIITGGGDVNPVLYGEEVDGAYGINDTRDTSDVLIIKAAVKAGVPVLGICRGCQVVNVALGGSLVQDIPTQVQGHISHGEGERIKEKVHVMKIDPDSYVAGIFGTTELEINSSHHEAVKRIAPGLKVVGRAPDGVVEACEGLPEMNVVCLQFHPEAFARQGDETFLKVFTDLLERAAAHKK